MFFPNLVHSILISIVISIVISFVFYGAGAWLRALSREHSGVTDAVVGLVPLPLFATLFCLGLAGVLFFLAAYVSLIFAYTRRPTVVET